MPFKGHIDTPQSDLLLGWAVDEYGAPCEIAVSVNGGPPALVLSDGPRTDLTEAGISTGLGGFELDIGVMLAPGENEVALTFPDGTHLPGSPISRTVEGRQTRVVSYRGWIDSPQTKAVHGWALTTDGLPCEIIIDINGTEQFAVATTNPRPDLVKSGLSKGLGGFAAPVIEKLREGTNRVSIRFPDGKHLPGSPITRIVGDPNAWSPEPEVELESQVEPEPVGQSAPPAPPRPPVPSKPIEASPPAEQAVDTVAPERPSENEDAAALAPKPAAAASAPAASLPPPPPAQQTVAKKPAPAPEAKASPEKPVAKKVAPLPAAPRKKPPLPSLAELDELSLDDLSLAVAAGVISVPAPETRPAPPVQQEAPEQQMNASPQPEQPAQPAAPARKPGLLGRLFGRR